MCKVFIPKANPSHKRKVKRKTPSYKDPVTSKSCSHARKDRLMDPVTSEWVCTKCHCIVESTFIHKDHSKVKNQDILIWNREYDKSRWIYSGLDYLQGTMNQHLNDLCWLELLIEIPNPCVWYDVYTVFHKYRLTEYWTCFASYVGIEVQLNKKTIHYLFQYSYLGYTKYRISYLYLLYKFTQMFVSKEESRKIPMKASKTWIKKTDAWWKTICLEEGWKFYPSERVQILWNKDYIVYCLSEIRQKSINEVI